MQIPAVFCIFPISLLFRLVWRFSIHSHIFYCPKNRKAVYGAFWALYGHKKKAVPVKVPPLQFILLIFHAFFMCAALFPAHFMCFSGVFHVQGCFHAHSMCFPFASWVFFSFFSYGKIRLCLTQTHLVRGNSPNTRAHLMRISCVSHVRRFVQSVHFCRRGLPGSEAARSSFFDILYSFTASQSSHSLTAYTSILSG